MVFNQNEHRRENDSWPLTEAQSGLWYAQRLDPDNPIYNTGQYLEIDGPLDLAAFQTAVNRALDEADALSIRVDDDPDGPRQILDEAQRPRLQVVDLCEEDDPKTSAHRWIERDMERPLDPTRDPLALEALFILGEERYVWYQRIHHLVIDGYGTSLLTGRICDLYTARARGINPTGSGFGDYAAVLREDQAYQASEKREIDRQFWLQEFQDRPVVIGLGQGRAITARGFLRSGCELSGRFSESLQTLSTASGVSWPDALTALIAAYLRRHTGEAETVVGVPTMNRMGTSAARTPAMIMNVLPVRVAVDEEAPLKAFLTAIAQRLRRARRHGKYRSEQLRRDLGLLGEDRRLHGPLINILPFNDSPKLAGLSTRLRVLGTGAVDDLTFIMRGSTLGHDLTLELDANPNLFDFLEIEEHVDRLRVFLETSVTTTRLADVPTLTPVEHRRWNEGVNETAHPVEDTTLTELIERAIRRTPDAPALVFGSETLNYAEFEARRNALSDRLAAAGVRRGDLVAVAAPRSFELVLALTAILRIGAAYLPLDPEHPPQRLATILESARPKAVLSFSHLKEIFPESTPLLLFDEEAGDVPAAIADAPMPSDAAYVIYTSGSTGTPKGVVIEHRAIVNRLEWMRMHYNFTSADRILQKTPATFDVSVWEFFLPLIVGATLVIAPPDAHKDPGWLASIIREQRISVMHFVPSMLAVFLADPSATGISLRAVFCSGEEPPAPLRDRFHSIVKSELHNLYGPTEAAVDVTYWPASADDESVPVPIGFPVWNTKMYVLDDRLRPAPPGTPGELYIGGVQLAREYLGRPDLTEERFLMDPFGGPGARMYRTGDLASRRRDGAIVFLGRLDHQVKIRGQRIELGEIESAVMDSGAARQAVVIAREDRPGDQRIVAYITPREGDSIDVDAIRSHLAARLPETYMPSAFVVLEQIPVTRNGKLDRAALPVPERSAAPTGRPPETLTERRLAEFFIETLGLENNRLSVEQDFFSLGGHSLLAARLVSRIRREWSLEFGLGVLFTNPTVGRLAAYLDTIRIDKDQTAAVSREGLGVLIELVRAESERDPLFCIHPAGGVSWCYGALGRALHPARQVYGLQARGLDLHQATPETMTRMADDYIEQIRQVYPHGPVHLAGWSVGGIIAQAVAARLQRRGDRVGVLAMLDSYPSDCWRNEPEPDENMALRALLYIAGHDPDSVTKDMLTRESVIGFLRRIGHPLGEFSDEALTGVVRVVDNNSRLVRRHFHDRYEGPLLYFRAALDHTTDALSPQQWAPYVGSIRVHDLPFYHAQMVGPDAVRLIAPALSERFETSR